MTALGSLVMEGRDIGSAVFPDARSKFYLNASAEERARRRHVEMMQKGAGEELGAVTESLEKRDKIDSTRKMDPLRIPDGAEVIDSTGMTADQVADLIAGKTAGR
jgi:cytidylate kinase